MNCNNKINSISISDVSLTEPYLANALGLEVEYLTSFDPDRWLVGFRETAGLSTRGKQRYGGWEETLIAGHAFGHYLGACALAYESPDVSDEDKKKLYDDISYIIDELLVCQANSKGKAGFLFCAKIINKDNVEQQFDNVEIGKTHIITEAWVPWYTIHKIMQGLLDVYNHMGYEPALEVAKGLGDWSYNRATGWSEQLNDKVLATEYGGMNDCLYGLYAASGDVRYAEAAHRFDETALFEKVLQGKKDTLTNRHANTTIPKFVGALQRYYYLNGKKLNGETVDASKYLEYAKAFFDMVNDKHTYITGGNSEWEHFGSDYVLDAERTNCNNETCNIHNILKLARMLFMITGDVKYLDFYENAYINSILSSQNPETGMTMYFQPMATGYFKVYGERYNKFWCCTGTGMENFTKLGDSIYFEDEEGIYVGMYLSSEVAVSGGQKFVLRQDSKVLEGGKSVFTIKNISSDSAKRSTTVRFRIPDWAAGDLSISYNGKPFEARIENGFACITESFINDDKIEVVIPMTIKAYPLPDNRTSIGFKYGPIVLSAALGTEDMSKTTTGMNVTIPMNKVVSDEYIILKNGNSHLDVINSPMDFFEKTDDTTFKLKGTGLVFTPHYLQYRERYGIYWYFVTEKEYKSLNEEPRQSEDTISDTVQPGYGQYENDDLHNMQEFNTVSVTNDGTYRFAKEGGQFTYNFAVTKGTENYLSLTLRKADNGKSLRISSGKEILFEDTLDYIGLDDCYELRVAVPSDIVDTAVFCNANGEKHDVLPITFSGFEGAESARVCDFIYMMTSKRLYESDNDVAYFVNCGDHNVYTAAEGEKFGLYNSLMEQLYGYDKVTGKKWGLIDDPTDRYNGGSLSKALYTANTWAYEFNTDGNLAKEYGCRYTKNQYENGIAERYLDYAFELPNGKYNVEIGFSNPWGCSNGHNVYANLGKNGEQVLAEALCVNGEPLKKEVVVSDGVLTLNFRNATSSGLAINVTYIKVSFAK